MEKAITFLGKDSGFGKKNTSAYAIVNGRLLLIDCGYTVMTELQNRNLLDGISGIDVIITHMHGDHVGSLSQLALYCYFNQMPINIITACKEIDNFLTITGVPRYKQVAGFPKERYTRNNDFVTFIQTDHVGDELDCYGFSAEINGSHIVYTGDTKTIEPYISYLHSGTQFYTDASTVGDVHLNIEDNLPYLEELTKKSIDVYLMHLNDERKIRELIKDYPSIRICDD